MGELSNVFVVIMGLATVFIGLICIIILCEVMGAICKALIKDEKKDTPSQVLSPVSSASASIENKQELVAASCAVIAEEIGCDAKNIRVLSFKRV